MARPALAVTCLCLSIIGWHVPPKVRDNFRICQLLSSVAVYSIDGDYVHAAAAFLIPSFGKRPQISQDQARKRTRSAYSGSAQTSDAGDDESVRPAESSEATDAATEHVAAETDASMSMDDIVAELSTH